MEPNRAYVFPPSRDRGMRPLRLTVGLPSPAPFSFSRCGNTWNITTCVYIHVRGEVTGRCRLRSCSTHTIAVDPTSRIAVARLFENNQNRIRRPLGTGNCPTNRREGPSYPRPPQSRRVLRHHRDTTGLPGYFVEAIGNRQRSVCRVERGAETSACSQPMQLTSPNTTVVVMSPFLFTMSCVCRICEIATTVATTYWSD